jgi:hypothetical protein
MVFLTGGAWTGGAWTGNTVGDGVLNLLGEGSRERSRGGVLSCGIDVGVGNNPAQLVDGLGVEGSPPGTVCGVGGADCSLRVEVAAASTSLVRSRISVTCASSSEVSSSSSDKSDPSVGVGGLLEA